MSIEMQAQIMEKCFDLHYSKSKLDHTIGHWYKQTGIHTYAKHKG